MYKLIGIDQKEYGPVSADQIRQWQAEGRVDARTRIQREGIGDWQELGQMPEFAVPPQFIPPPRGWICQKCGEHLEPQFDTCWRCATPRPWHNTRVKVDLKETPQSKTVIPTPQWRVKYELIRGTFQTWDQLFERAAAFANDIGRERLIGISHSEDKDDGVIAVWYWSQEPSGE